MTTTTTTYHLLAVTDELAARTHLGATEKGNVTFCGVRLLIQGDTRFGGKHGKGNGYTTAADLAAVDCKACQRTAAWKVTAATGVATIGIATYTVPASKAKAEAAPATGQAKPPSTRKRPSAATRAAAKAEQAAADQAAGNAG